MTTEEVVNQLKQLKADLQLRTEALDRAIEALHGIASDLTTAEPTPTERLVETLADTQKVEPITPYKGKTKSTTFESAIDLNQFNVPEGPWTCKCGTLNPAGSSTCMECKKKRPKGIRTE